MTKHEEFLKQVKERAEVHGYLYACDVLKLIAIIEKLKEQRDSMMPMGDMRIFCDKELDEIVGHG